MVIQDIQRARELLRDVIRDTPVLFSYTYSGLTEGDVWFKAECLQRTGSFKLRGAYNKIRSLPEDTVRVVCASAGNHAQGVALASHLAGLPSTVVMPENAPITKIERARGYGAEVTLWGSTLEEAYEQARELAQHDGHELVHPFDDPAVIAGQGTLGLELLEQLPDMKTLLVPVGGGGLISGVAMAVKESAPGVRVIGVQAEGSAAAFMSYHKGQVVSVEKPRTMADGIRVGRPSALTLELMQRYVDDIVTVDDDELTDAMELIMERSKLVVEASGAAGVAALAAEKVRARGTVCAVLSGGNIDLSLLARVVERALTRSHRYSVFRITIPDRPGSLSCVLGRLAELKVNILEVKHRRAGYQVPIGSVEVELLVETRDELHAEQLMATMRGEGWDIEEERLG